MRISVIIPTYNEEKVIGKCLESLSKQSTKDFETIVVDDGSTDGTTKVVSQITIHKSPVVVFHQKHLGPGSARNIGASKAKGKVLVFVDADMTFDKDFISKLVHPILKGKSKGVFSKDEYVSNWDDKWARCWNINEGWEDKKRHPRSYPNKQKVFRAILKSEFDRVGGFDGGGHYTDDYLSDKLGYTADLVKGAKFYHENPNNLKEVYAQAKWASKRKYKLGFIGVVFALLRSSLPVSLIFATVKSISNKNPDFVVFKVVYDLGQFVGILEYTFTGKGSK